MKILYLVTPDHFEYQTEKSPSSDVFDEEETINMEDTEFSIVFGVDQDDEDQVEYEESVNIPLNPQH